MARPPTATLARRHVHRAPLPRSHAHAVSARHGAASLPSLRGNPRPIKSTPRRAVPAAQVAASRARSMECGGYGPCLVPGWGDWQATSRGVAYPGNKACAAVSAEAVLRRLCGGIAIDERQYAQVRRRFVATVSATDSAAGCGPVIGKARGCSGGGRRVGERVVLLRESSAALTRRARVQVRRSSRQRCRRVTRAPSRKPVRPTRPGGDRRIIASLPRRPICPFAFSRSGAGPPCGDGTRCAPVPPTGPWTSERWGSARRREHASRASTAPATSCQSLTCERNCRMRRMGPGVTRGVVRLAIG